jgi:hypothetical protein
MKTPPPIWDGGNTEGPRERARHHRGLALALSGSQGLRLGATTAPEKLIARSAVADHRERDHVTGIAMQIPTRHAGFASLRERIRSTYVETFTRIETMGEKRIARLFGLAF